MPYRFRFVLLTALLFSFTNVPLAVSGQTEHAPKMFGIGEPANIDDLPPGRTKDRLASLPEPARERALEWLQRFEFPAADLDAMQIDDQGAVLYVEPMLPSPVPDGTQD